MGPFFHTWPQIEVRMMDTRDAEHELEIEVSENENRKDFSRTEREEVYTRYVRMRLQQSGPIGPRVHAVEAEAAKLLGTSRTNMNREREILANRDLLDPSDFADWDEGKLSTNKAYQRIGEILRELPTRAGKRTDLTSSTVQEEVTKTDALKESGISRSQAYDLQALAANPDVVQAVLDKAEAGNRYIEDKERLVRFLTNLSAPTNS